MVVFGNGICVCGGVLCDDVVRIVVPSERVCVSESVFCSVLSVFPKCGSESTCVLRLCMYQICLCCAWIFVSCSLDVRSVTSLLYSLWDVEYLRCTSLVKSMPYHHIGKHPNTEIVRLKWESEQLVLYVAVLLYTLAD